MVLSYTKKYSEYIFKLGILVLHTIYPRQNPISHDSTSKIYIFFRHTSEDKDLEEQMLAKGLMLTPIQKSPEK